MLTNETLKSYTVIKMMRHTIRQRTAQTRGRLALLTLIVCTSLIWRLLFDQSRRPQSKVAARLEALRSHVNGTETPREATAVHPDLVFMINMATHDRPEGRTLSLLNHSVSSILNQTNPNWVLYLTGDAFDPSQVATLHPVLSRVPPKKLMWANLNVPGERERWPEMDSVWRCAGAEALNHGLERVEMSYNAARGNMQGVILTHLDDDDAWTPEHLAVLAQTYARFSLASFVYTKSMFRTHEFPAFEGPLAYDNYPPVGRRLVHNSASWRLADFYGWRYRSCDTTDTYVDADMWNRMAAYMANHGLKSVFNPRMTSYHLTEAGV